MSRYPLIAETMGRAILSFTYPPGFQPSSFAHNSASAGPVMRRILTIGVSPINERTSGWSFMIFLLFSAAFVLISRALRLIMSYAGFTNFQKKS